MSIRIHRGEDRFCTEASGPKGLTRTRHAFSFGAHYDPENVGFASMVAFNDEEVPAGGGYPDHPHRDQEIVTWVLSGTLRHTDSTGAVRLVPAGSVQRLSAGSGVVHAEVATDEAPARFLQTWLRPDRSGTVPSSVWEQADPETELREVAGPDGLPLGTAGARLLVGTVDTGRLLLPEAARIHLMVVEGEVSLGDRALADGDAARITDQPGRPLEVVVPGRLAIWAFENRGRRRGPGRGA